MLDSVVDFFAGALQALGNGNTRPSRDFRLSASHPFGDPKARWSLHYERPRRRAREVVLRWVDPPHGYQTEHRLGDVDRHDRRHLEAVGSGTTFPKLEARVTWLDEDGARRSTTVTTRPWPH